MGNVHEHAGSAIHVDIFEERRREGHVRRTDAAAFAFGDAGPHEGGAAVGHDGLDVGKVDVDKAMTEHNVADAANGVAEDFVGELEGAIKSEGLVGALHDIHELLVVHHDHGVDRSTEVRDTLGSERTAALAFELERLGDHGHGKDAHFAGNVTHDRSGTRTGTTTHAGSNEDHVGALHGFLEFFDVFFGSLAANLRLHAGTESLGKLLANLDLVIGKAKFKSLSIGIHGVVFHTFDVHTDHAVHSVAAGTADTEHLHLGVVEDGFVHFDMGRPVYEFTHGLSPCDLSVCFLVKSTCGQGP